MEYIISTEPFKDSKVFGKIFYHGDFNICNNNISVFEGDLHYITKSDFIQMSDESIKNKQFIGNYNFFRYNKETHEFLIKNDKFGTFSLFLYIDSNKMIISNNVWKIIQLLSEEEITINREYFKFYIGSWGVNLDEKTLFNNISEINPAKNITGNVNNIRSIKKENYYTLEHSRGTKFSETEAVEALDNDLNYTFSRIKEINQDEILGFGNSGGLDSRLIPIYARQNSLKLHGLTTLNKYSRFFFKSATYQNAQKIAQIYKFKNKYICYKHNNHNDRILLDIRNNPFGTAEQYKNPYDKLPKFNFYVTGGNGFIVGGNWEEIVSKKKDSAFIDSFINYNNKLNLFSWSNGVELKNKIFEKETIKSLNDQKLRFYEENSQKDNLSILRSYHQYSLNKRSPAGGYESVNRLFKTYNIYYPIVFENTLNWDNSFFYDRRILKGLIKKKSEKLYNIPSQDFEMLDGSSLSFYQKQTRRFRTWGLDYEIWVQEEKFITFAEKVLKKENTLFYDLLGISRADFLKFDFFKEIHPHIAMDILKLKKILDIVVYKEYSFINNENYNIK